MLDNSPELKYENAKGSGYGILHIRNKVTLYYYKKCVFEEAYVD